MILHPEQKYVVELADKLGIEIKLVHHERATVSCDEKLRLLHENHRYTDWTIDRIIKALYFTNNGQPLIGIIAPETGSDIKQKDILFKTRTMGISRSRAERYYVNPNKVPEGMVFGTCTPFPRESSVGNGISDLVIIDHPSINDKLVDISMGVRETSEGEVREGLMTSMHITYKGIYEILKKQFGARVHLYQSNSEK